MKSARGVLLAICIAVPLTAFAQTTTIRCESRGRRQNCAVESVFRVRLVRQLSVSSCEEGESWGYTRNTVCVDHGCRADFEVTFRREEGRGFPLICSSYGGRQFCAADARFGVELRRQLSNRECIEGRTWGYDDRGIWVDRGCRAEFLVLRGRCGYGEHREGEHRDRQHHVVLCESDYNHSHTCGADTRFGVELRRQTSRTDCVFNRTWGYNSRGIWVSNGCRAEFTVWER